MSKTTIGAFVDSYEVKNGYVGSQDVLNKAPHQVKLELDEMWTWISGGINSDTLPDGTIQNYLINDTTPYNNISKPLEVTRSASFIQQYVFNSNISAADRSALQATWNSKTIYDLVTSSGAWSSIDISMDGGSWT